MEGGGGRVESAEGHISFALFIALFSVQFDVSVAFLDSKS